MSRKFTATENFVIQNVILSYPHVFTPRQVGNDDIPKFSVKMFLDNTTAGIVSQKMQELASQLRDNETQNPKWRWPISPVTPAEAQNPRLQNHYVMNGSADVGYPPQVVDQNRQPIIDRGQIYPGVVAAVGVRLYTYNKKGNIGIGCGLIAIMKQRDGEPLVESVDVNSMFSSVQTTPSQGQMPGGMQLPQNPQQIPNAAQNPQQMPWMQQPQQPVQNPQQMPWMQQPQQPAQDQAPQFSNMPGMPGGPFQN